MSFNKDATEYGGLVADFSDLCSSKCSLHDFDSQLESLVGYSDISMHTDGESIVP